jgi:hypothetical protein
VHHERRKFREACETAGATASTIFHTLDDDPYSSGSYTSSAPFRRAASTSSDEFSDDLYAFDDNVMPRGSLRHRRRSSSVSFNSRPMIIPPGTSYQPPSGIPIPVNQSPYNYPGGSPYNTGGSPYNTGGSPYNTGGSPYSNPSPFNGPSSFPQQYPGGVQGVPVVGSTYDPNQAVPYQGSASYPQQTYIQSQPGMTQAVPMVPGSAIIIHQPAQQSSRHKHHHKHRSGSRDSRRRHRSQSDVYPVY